MKQIAFLLLIALFLTGCSKKSTQVPYKLSDDLCLICDNSHYKVLGNDTIELENIITPNNDGINDQFRIKRYGDHESIDSLSFTIFNREGQQIVHFDHYLNNWPAYIPSQYQQDLTGLANGLYKYRLSSTAGNMDGLFIIMFKKDEYTDVQASDAACFNCIRCIDENDPALHLL
jgi:gliding motility-associated-like protein